MAEELTALDATFLELEEIDQGAHMHIGGVLVFEPRPGGVPSVEEVAGVLGSRLAGLPRYRQRLSSPKTGGLHWPRWEPDPRFDAAKHVRRAQLAGPGTEEDLREWAGEYFSERLDRTRPLWELVVIGGLEHGRWAMASKTHHSMVDGVGSVDAALVMLDSEPDSSREPVHPASPAEATGGNGGGLPGARLFGAPMRIAGAGVRLARGTLGVATHPRRVADALTRSRALVELIIRDEVVAAAPTSLNVPIGGKRRLGVIELSLDEIKGIKRDLGGTVNDVMLAVSAGGLRRLLLERDEELPDQGLRAMVPMNIRTAGDRLALGNRITSLFVHLPVTAADPLERYRLQMAEAETLKSGTQALGASAIIDLTGHAPPIIHSFLARSLYATRLFNVTITNVPGPQQPLYAFGSRMEAVWPIVPLAAEHAIGIAIFSYDGRVFITINADRDTTPDLDVLLEGIEESVAELAAARSRA